MKIKYPDMVRIAKERKLDLLIEMKEHSPKYLKRIESTHLLVSIEENKIINKYKTKYGYIPQQINFDGKTECFSSKILEEFKYFL